MQEELVINKDLQAAEQIFLGAGGIRRIESAIKSTKEKEDFRVYLRRYAQMCFPDYPWEITATNRYQIVDLEASITARWYIYRNEPVQYLSGIRVHITADEGDFISVTPERLPHSGQLDKQSLQSTYRTSEASERRL